VQAHRVCGPIAVQAHCTHGSSFPLCRKGPPSHPLPLPTCKCRQAHRVGTPSHRAHTRTVVGPGRGGSPRLEAAASRLGAVRGAHAQEQPIWPPFPLGPMRSTAHHWGCCFTRTAHSRLWVCVLQCKCATPSLQSDSRACICVRIVHRGLHTPCTPFARTLATIHTNICMRAHTHARARARTHTQVTTRTTDHRRMRSTSATLGRPCPRVCRCSGWVGVWGCWVCASRIVRSTRTLPPVLPA